MIFLKIQNGHLPADFVTPCFCLNALGDPAENVSDVVRMRVAEHWHFRPHVNLCLYYWD